MKKTGLFILLLSLAAVGCSREHIEVKSPDGQIRLEFDCNDDGLYYSVFVDDTPILLPSRMGLRTEGGADIMDGYSVKRVRVSHVDEVWTQPWGENKTIRSNYNEKAVVMKNDDGVELTVRFRVFDDGLGFRYEYNVPADSVFVVEELTDFRFAQDGLSWTIPASSETYEMLYVEQPISEVRSANTPATFRTDDGLYLSIHEAALYDFPEMTLIKSGERGFSAELAQWPDGIKARVGGEFTTPWRTMQISDRAVGLINSPLILNLNEPCLLDDTSWITPVKYIGVWWGMHLGVQSWVMGDRHGATTENAMKYIDFASANNVDAVLFEGWNEGWDTWGHGQMFDYMKAYDDFDIDEVVRYADERGVKLIGHHETGGNMPYYESQLDESLVWYADKGVHMLKTGYAGGVPDGHVHHGQYGVRHYRKVVEEAARNKVMLDAHEPIKPTGIRRTYPNMMTAEGVRGMEWNAWSEGNPPSHDVTLPFTRMLAGPMDYTPGVFDILYDNTRHSPDHKRWNDNDKGNSRVHTTLAKQIALWVILYSPMQMASDLIENYEGHPAFRFFSDFDADCDWSEALDGEPGDYIVIARRAGDRYFLGAATGYDSKDVSVSLDFLEPGVKYKAVVYADGQAAHWESNPLAYEINEKIVEYTDIIDLHMAPGGGAAITFMPEE